MDKALLDTDIFSEVLKGIDPQVVARARHYYATFARYTISVITVMEIVKSLYTESADEEPIGPKFVRGTDNKTSFIQWETVPYCPIEDSKYPKYELFPGDILVV